jgi:hypothetical protein
MTIEILVYIQVHYNEHAHVLLNLLIHECICYHATLKRVPWIRLVVHTCTFVYTFISSTFCICTCTSGFVDGLFHYFKWSWIVGGVGRNPTSLAIQM